MSWRASAAGLVVLLALCGCTDDARPETPAAAPSATAADEKPRATVLQRDFALDYRLDATTADGVPITLDGPRGTRVVPTVKDGTPVEAGDQVARVEVDRAYRAELAAAAGTSRIDAAALDALEEAAGVLRAPVAGVVDHACGHLTLAATGTDVVTPLSGLQDLRLRALDIRADATVETVVGQRDVACAHVWVVPDLDGDDESTATLRCRLPRTAETAPGLRAGLAVTSEVIADATLVPNAYVGSDHSGYVVTVVDGGTEREIPVDVGPSDGVVRVIRTPLPVGAELVLPATAP